MSNTYCSYPNINGIEGKKCPSIETEISSGLRDSEDLGTAYICRFDGRCKHKINLKLEKSRNIF